MKTIKGFSLIEVLVACALIGIGLLGVYGLQSKSNIFANELTTANLASSLADDFVQIARVYPEAFYQPIAADSDVYYLALTKNSLIRDGKLTVTSRACSNNIINDRNRERTRRLGCWLKDAEESIAEFQGASFSQKNGLLFLTLKWKGKENCYQNDKDKTACSYTTGVSI